MWHVFLFDDIGSEMEPAALQTHQPKSYWPLQTCKIIFDFKL
jgi:hypothetical protein